MKYLSYMLTLVVVILAAGCGNETGKKPNGNTGAKGASLRLYKNLPEDEIIARVDEFILRKKDVERQVNLRVRLFSNRLKSQKQKDRLNASREKFAEKIVGGFCNEALLYKAALDAGLKPSVQSREAQKRKYEKVFCKKKQDLESLKDFVGEYKADFVDGLERELMVNEYIRLNYSNDLVVTEQEIDKTIARITRYNANAKLTNEVQKAKARDLHLRAKNGEDFFQLADKYSEEPGKAPGGAMLATIEADFAGDKALWVAASNLVDGAVSPVTEGMDGYYIFKRLPINLTNAVSGLIIEQWNKLNLNISDTHDGINLLQIKVRKPSYYPENVSRDEIRKTGEKEGRQIAIKKAVALQRAKSVVKMPNIDELFPAKKGFMGLPVK